jgi:hypothetical protein
MIPPTFPRLLLAFVVAVLVATVLGSVVQTQYNLAGIASVGADVSGVRLSTTLGDIFSGFTPTYAGYVVLPSLLVGFAVAWWVSSWLASAPLVWFGFAGFLAILAGNPIVNWLSPVALLVGATRDVSCLVLMSLGGAIAGLVFVWMAFPRTSPVAAEPAVRRPRARERVRDVHVRPQA